MVDLAQLGQVVRNSHFQRPNRSALIKESAFAVKRNWLMAYAVTKDVQIVEINRHGLQRVICFAQLSNNNLKSQDYLITSLHGSYR